MKPMLDKNKTPNSGFKPFIVQYCLILLIVQPDLACQGCQGGFGTTDTTITKPLIQQTSDLVSSQTTHPNIGSSLQTLRTCLLGLTMLTRQIGSIEWSSARIQVVRENIGGQTQESRTCREHLSKQQSHIPSKYSDQYKVWKSNFCRQKAEKQTSFIYIHSKADMSGSLERLKTDSSIKVWKIF